MRSFIISLLPTCASFPAFIALSPSLPPAHFSFFSFLRQLQADQWRVVTASDDKTVKVCMSAHVVLLVFFDLYKYIYIYTSLLLLFLPFSSSSICHIVYVFLLSLDRECKQFVLINFSFVFPSFPPPPCLLPFLLHTLSFHALPILANRCGICELGCAW